MKGSRRPTLKPQSLARSALLLSSARPRSFVRPSKASSVTTIAFLSSAESLWVKRELTMMSESIHTTSSAPSLISSSKACGFTFHE